MESQGSPSQGQGVRLRDEKCRGCFLLVKPGREEPLPTSGLTREPDSLPSLERRGVAQHFPDEILGLCGSHTPHLSELIAGQQLTRSTATGHMLPVPCLHPCLLPRSTVG